MIIFIYIYIYLGSTSSLGFRSTSSSQELKRELDQLDDQVTAALFEEAGLVQPPVESTEAEQEGSQGLGEVGEHGEGAPATASTPVDEANETVPGTPSYMDVGLGDMFETNGGKPVHEVPSQQTSTDAESPPSLEATVSQEKKP